MRSILFYIPAEIAGLPVFGFGWLLILWGVFAAVSGWSLLRQSRAGKEISWHLAFVGGVAAVIAFILPQMVEADTAGRPLGLPIRGYGVMLMMATVAAVGLAAYRARQVGIDPEAIFSLAFVMFIAGIIGARLFFVLEYREQFMVFANGVFDLRASAAAMINFVKGGLVVYGSVLFGVPAGIWFCRQHALPVLAVGDIIAPSMVVGLALGRIGCFLNGCCFGGVCLTHDYAVAFPAGSPPYVQQEEYGWGSGVWLREAEGKVSVAYVAPQGAAAAAGLASGDQIASINGATVSSLPDAQQKLAAGHGAFEVETADGRVLRWLSASGPPRSVPVHPTQLYAAIDAALLALVLWLYFPYRRRDGEVFAILVTVHPISRFFLEMIRSDEPGQFGTALTISQWISLGILAAGVALWIFLERRPRGSALPTAN